MRTPSGQEANKINRHKQTLLKHIAQAEKTYQRGWKPATVKPHPRQAEIDAYNAIQALKYGES